MNINHTIIQRRTISLPKRLPRKKKKMIKKAMSYKFVEGEAGGWFFTDELTPNKDFKSKYICGIDVYDEKDNSKSIGV